MLAHCLFTLAGRQSGSSVVREIQIRYSPGSMECRSRSACSDRPSKVAVTGGLISFPNGSFKVNPYSPFGLSGLSLAVIRLSLASKTTGELPRCESPRETLCEPKLSVTAYAAAAMRAGDATGTGEVCFRSATAFRVVELVSSCCIGDCGFELAEVCSEPCRFI